MSAQLEEQIRQIADAAFDQTDAVPADRLVPRTSTAWRRPRSVMVAVAAIIVVAAVAGVIALGGRDERADTVVSTFDDEPSPEDGLPATTVPLAPAPDFADAFSARGLLAQVPIDGVDASSIRVEGSDVGRIAGLAGAELDEVDTWLDLIRDQEVEIAIGRWALHGLTEPNELAAEFGIPSFDIERYLSADQYIGSPRAERLALPLDVFKLASEPMQLIDDAGDDEIVDIGSGEDGARDINARTAVRSIGEPLRLGVDAQRSLVSVSQSTAYTRAWLESSTPTLADEPDLAEAAAILDRDDELYTVSFRNYDRSLGRLAPQDRDRLDDAADMISEEFSTIAVGLSGRGNTQQTTIVYVFADDAAAAASIETITRLYSPNTAIDSASPDISAVGDLLTVDSVDAVGRTVVVTAGTGGHGTAGLYSLLTSVSHFTHHR